MRITFVKEGNNLYAISQSQVYKGYLHDELMWAEITPAVGSYFVRWEDDYSNPIPFEDEVQARVFVERNHYHHNPVSTGSRYLADDEEY